MPQFGCCRGHTISLVAVQSPHEVNLISDPDFDELRSKEHKEQEHKEQAP